MSIDYFLRTWKVIDGDKSVKKDQRITIQRKPHGGDSNDLEFVVPSTRVGGVSGFGDGHWPDVSNLQYENGLLTASAKVGQQTHNITITADTANGHTRIICSVSPADVLASLSKGKRIVRRLRRILEEADDVPRALPRVKRGLHRLGHIFEEVGEWEAEDDGG